MDKKNIYTSTGIKLMHHTEVVSFLKKGMSRPISLQVAPTSRCNLNCVFCSNARREKHEDLDMGKLLHLMSILRGIGLRTIEWTGGGDPLLYEGLVDGVYHGATLGLKQGLITNGINLHYFTEDFINLFRWIRISMNSLDYTDGLIIPKMRGALGFSYVMNEKTTGDTLNKLRAYVSMHMPRYVRIVPNCLASDEEQIENNQKYSAMVKDWGEPFFYQDKVFSRPDLCWWGYLKPFLLHNEWVYPCSSVVLNQDSERTFHENYQWVHMDDLFDLYKTEMVPFSNENCGHCVFREQNDMVDNLIHPNGMEDFV